MREVKFNSREEWLQFRKEHVGSSDAPIIMGTARWKTNDNIIKTPLFLWKEKLGMIKSDYDTEAMKFGREKEPMLRQLYSDQIDDIVEDGCFVRDDYPFLMASLDCINLSRTRGGEIKCANKEDHETARQGKVPDKYYPQVQHHMLVMGFDKFDYFSFHNEETILITIPRDEEYIKNLLEKESEFWNYVTSFTQPPIGADDFIERDEDWKIKAETLWEIKQEIKILQKKEKELAEMLKNDSKGHSSCFGGYRYTCITQRGLVDYKAIPELSGVNLDQYRKESTMQWRLTKEKE